MELERSRERFAAQGLGVAAISHDSRELLSQFADRVGISYPLLSDPGSAIIRSFGILNTNIPEGHAWHGIPFPGTYVVDETGRVVAKYFEQGHRQRTTADTVLTKVRGVGGGERTRIETPHLALDLYATQDRVRPGNRLMLVLDVELPPRMHVYAPGEHGYRPVSFSLEADPHLWAHETEYPEPEVLHLRAIQETVPVYHGRFRITRDVTVSPRLEEPRLKISGTFAYQACDDEICYRPQEVPVELELELEPLDRVRSPEQLRRKGRPRPVSPEP